MGPQEEDAFQNWIRSLAWYSQFINRFGGPPNLNDPQYDYRAAYRAGISPQPYPQDNNFPHWPSMTPSGQPLKSADHPTMWKEQFMRQTGVNPDDFGMRSPQDADQMFSYYNNTPSGK